jgi:N-acyl-D-aspartate/D-glutamate deacylase
MHDLLIKGGTLIDGTGAPARQADLAIRGDRIVAIGTDLGPAKQTIDATGLLVTPGFVDIHTHYDGQVTWDPLLTPSSLHGVTTVVVGSCGVGFAPVKPDRREWLIGLMEGVEDIPGAALTEGMRWGWETFPEYLDALDKLELAVDFAAQVPHGAVRTYVMGDRGAQNEAATPEDVAAMAAVVQEAVEAGALGFSTSRTLIHKGSDGVHVPGTFAETSELMGIARGMQAAGGAVFQMTSNHTDMADEFAWMRTLARDTGNPVSFNLLQTDAAPDLWKHMLGLLDEAEAEGLPVRAQVCGRPNGVLMSWQGTAVPFLNRGAYLCNLHFLPWEERLEKLRDPETRQAIISDEAVSLGEFEDFILGSFHKMYRLGSPPEYEPDPSTSAAAIAEARGCTPEEVVYDWLMEDDGQGIVYFPIFNYSGGDHAVLHQLLQHPRTALGLGDGGAHCGAVCDASLPTYMLTHWVRDRQRGPRLPLEQVIRMQTTDTAALFGLEDRGRLAEGYLADVNLIDLDALTLEAPRMIHDLPAGGRRYMQKAEGYRATIKSGQVVMRDGVAEGPLPGRLLRGRRAAPAVC